MHYTVALPTDRVDEPDEFLTAADAAVGPTAGWSSRCSPAGGSVTSLTLHTTR